MVEIADPYSYQCDMRWGQAHKRLDGTYGHWCIHNMFHWENHQCVCGSTTPIHIEKDYGPGPVTYYNSPTVAHNNNRTREDYPKWNSRTKRTPVRDDDGRLLRKRRLQG